MRTHAWGRTHSTLRFYRPGAPVSGSSFSHTHARTHTRSHRYTHSLFLPAASRRGGSEFSVRPVVSSAKHTLSGSARTRCCSGIWKYIREISHGRARTCALGFPALAARRDTDVNKRTELSNGGAGSAGATDENAPGHRVPHVAVCVCGLCAWWDGGIGLRDGWRTHVAYSDLKGLLYLPGRIIFTLREIFIIAQLGECCWRFLCNGIEGKLYFISSILYFGRPSINSIVTISNVFRYLP